MYNPTHVHVEKLIFTRKNSRSPHFEIIFINLQALTMTRQGHQ